MIQSTRTRRKLTFETLMEMPSEPESKAFYRYQGTGAETDDRIEVLNDTFTLVLSRDVRKNARVAAHIAFEIAHQHADLDVFYVNTYAGVGLMKEAFSDALKRSGIQPPPTPRLEKAGELEPGGSGEDARPTREELVVEDSTAEEVPAASGAKIDPEEVPAPPRPKRPADFSINRIYTTPALWKKSEEGHWELRREMLTDEEWEYLHWVEPPKKAVEAAPVEAIEDEDDEEWDEDPDEEPESGPSVLGNLFIYDVPLGTWDMERLKADILGRGRGTRDSASETGTSQQSASETGTTPQPPPSLGGGATTPQPPPIPFHSIGGGVGAVVILNSFEFASMSRGQREKMVMQLIELRDTLGLTVVIFSHEMKRDLAAGLPGRGPLGVISANAGSVQRLNDPFEHLIRNRKKESGLENRSNSLGNRVIHEAQMRSGFSPGGESIAAQATMYSQPRRRYEPYRKIPVFRTELEKIQWFREQAESPDYHADPWINGVTQRLGRELLPLARSRVLQHYYEKRPNHVFTKGQEPTEYEIITGTYEPKEFEKKYLL